MALTRRGSHEKYLEHRDFVRERKRKNKLLAVEYKGGICEHCKEVFPPCVYDFHHVDPSVKDGSASVFLNRSWERVKEEVDKCTLLCANCHRLIHYKGNEMNDITRDMDEAQKILAEASGKLPRIEVRPWTKEETDKVQVDRSTPDEHRPL